MKMQMSKDNKELLSALREHSLLYLLVGAMPPHS